ncbi:MAG: phenylalanine--tRNA ligase subunit beta, partial [Phycisphaerae bacterium]|nr:phenylalanine--tRNA ligase subunit beta [Phycisphaerae bacterium]
APLYAGYPPDARARALPAFPGIDRDLSVIVAESVAWSSIAAAVHAAELPLFESLAFVGAYRGKQTGTGKKSVTLRVVFRAHDRTLRRDEVDGSMHALGAALTEAVGAEIRA